MGLLPPDELEALRLSLRVGFWNLVIGLPLAIAVAWLLARRRFPGKELLNGLVHPSLILPPVVTGYLLLILYGRWFARARPDPGRFDEIVELRGIDHLLARRPRSLSGGEKQRVAIGRALLSDPAALVMDEPLASLDAPRKAEILPYLERLRRQARLPIVYVSHSIDEVARLASTMVLLSEGRVAAVGPVAEVMTRLDLRPMTGRFEAGVVLEATVQRHDEAYQLTMVSLGDQTLSVPHLDAPFGARVRLRIRARDVALATQPPAGISIQNVLRGTVVELRREEGPFAEVNVDVGGARLTARLTRRAADDLGLAPGRPVFALVKTIALDRVTTANTDPAADLS